MRGRFLTTATSMLVIGCLLVAFAATPASPLAIVGYVILALALVAAIAALMQPKSDTASPVRLEEAERNSLRAELEANGSISAVRQLRHNHPDIGLVSAKKTVDALAD